MVSKNEKRRRSSTLILFSGKNVKVSIIRWLRTAAPIPFRILQTDGSEEEKEEESHGRSQEKERRILRAALAYGNAYRVYGFNLLDLPYLPAPPIDGVTVSGDFGVAPLEILGKLFAFTFKPIPIGGRAISITGSLSKEFLPEVLSSVWNYEAGGRRKSFEPAPEYGIQLVAVSMIPEFADRCFVVETHMAIPTRVRIQGSSGGDKPIVSFNMDFLTPYLSWYTDVLPPPDESGSGESGSGKSGAVPAPLFSSDLLTIRDISIRFPTGIWADLLGLIYSFAFSLERTIAPAYTFPEVEDSEVNVSGARVRPLVADEWGSVAQSVKEGPIAMQLEIQAGLASDVNLEVFQLTNIYNYVREQFPIDIVFSDVVTLRAMAMVESISTSIAPDETYMLRAILRLSEPINIF
jgi:hypothetical protein